MKFLFWVGLTVVGASTFALMGFGVLAVIHLVEEHLKAQKQTRPVEPVRHDHDCLVNACRFHVDSQVNKTMYQWLASNKLRGVVIIDHDLKLVALSLIIAEIRKRRPIAGEESSTHES